MAWRWHRVHGNGMAMVIAWMASNGDGVEWQWHADAVHGMALPWIAWHQVHGIAMACRGTAWSAWQWHGNGMDGVAMPSPCHVCAHLMRALFFCQINPHELVWTCAKMAKLFSRIHVKLHSHISFRVENSATRSRDGPA